MVAIFGVDWRTRPGRPSLRLVREGDLDWRAHLREARPRDCTVAELVREFLAYQEQNDSPSLEGFRVSLGVFARAFGAFRVRDLKPEHIEALSKARRGQVEEQTAARDLTLWTSLLEHGLETGACEINVARLIRRSARPRRVPADPGRPASEVLSLAQITRIVYDLRLPFSRRLVWVGLLTTGARPAELYGANGSDYVADEPFGEIRWERQWISRKRRTRSTKTRRVRRSPVIPALREFLARRQEWAKRVFGRELGPDDPLFPCPIEDEDAPYPRRMVPGRWHEQRARRWWRRDLRLLGIRDPAAGPRRIYCTRHTFISVLLRAGAIADAVRPITHTSKLRHGDAFSIYAHMDWESICAAASHLELDAAIRADAERTALFEADV